MAGKVKTIYENADVLVVNKPSGVSVTKDRSGTEQLTDILRRQMPGEEVDSLRLVHRLDKDTSGVLLLAKNKDAQSRFSSSFAKRKIEKLYLAIVSGAVIDNSGVITTPLVANRKKPGRMKPGPRKKGKHARTEWRLVADYGGVCLLVVRPVTGRTHQIRVHMADVGLPLAIDPYYGGSGPLYLSDYKPDYRQSKHKSERPLINRLTLHAYQLRFAGPVPSLPQTLVAKPDKRFGATVKMLSKHNPLGPEAFVNEEELSLILEGKPLEYESKGGGSDYV